MSCYKTQCLKIGCKLFIFYFKWVISCILRVQRTTPFKHSTFQFLVQKYAICALSCDKKNKKLKKKKMQTNQQSRYRQIWWCQSFLNHKKSEHSQICVHPCWDRGKVYVCSVQSGYSLLFICDLLVCPSSDLETA